jgi:hypothetical protein
MDSGQCVVGGISATNHGLNIPQRLVVGDPYP